MSTNSAAPEKEQKVFAEMQIARIYVKDSSFEIPNAPEIFQANWEPKLEFELDTKTQQLNENLHEVVLRVTVTTKLGDKVAYIAEVHQAGMFDIRNFPADQKQRLLGAYCPSILYPYLRQVIANAVVQGGFPPLNLTPINFDTIFDQHLQSQKGQPKTNANGEALSS